MHQKLAAEVNPAVAEGLAVVMAARAVEACEEAVEKYYMGRVAIQLQIEVHRLRNLVAAGIPWEEMLVARDTAAAPSMEEIDLEVSMQVVECKAAGKLPQAVHMVLVKMGHSSHLVNHHRELVE